MKGSTQSKTKKLEPRWPRDHYSWSQYNIWVNQGPREYALKYIYDEAARTNPRMLLGKQVAEMVENDLEQEDEALEHLRIFLPRYQYQEYKIEEELNGIKLVGFLDGFDEDPMKVGEYKTGRLWTKGMADKTEQLHWYALLLYLKFGVDPGRVPMVLHWMPTEWKEGEPLKPTGDIENFETRRTLRDCLDVGKRITDSWKKIGEFCAIEYASLGL